MPVAGKYRGAVQVVVWAKPIFADKTKVRTINSLSFIFFSSSIGTKNTLCRPSNSSTWKQACSDGGCQFLFCYSQGLVGELTLEIVSAKASFFEPLVDFVSVKAGQKARGRGW